MGIFIEFKKLSKYNFYFFSIRSGKFFTKKKQKLEPFFAGKCKLIQEILIKYNNIQKNIQANKKCPKVPTGFEKYEKNSFDFFHPFLIFFLFEKGWLNEKNNTTRIW